MACEVKAGSREGVRSGECEWGMESKGKEG